MEKILKATHRGYLTLGDKEHIKDFIKKVREFTPRLTSNPSVYLEHEKEQFSKIICLIIDLEKLI